jgi:hypothetical protein
MRIDEPVTPKLIARYERELVKADALSKKRCDARGALGAGSSRARITSANAAWMSAAEHRDRLAERLERAKAILAGMVPAQAQPGEDV